jgi:predicted ATP-grasp superfamily ATP-dependent carboligase
MSNTKAGPTLDEPTPPGRSKTYDVLVLDAGTRQSLATVRSLGRAGLRVAVGECFAECDPTLPVLAFCSRYSAGNVTFPSFADDLGLFGRAVVRFVAQNPTRVVLPASDGSVAALAHRREEFAALGSRLALPPESALSIANDKDRTLAVAKSLGIDHPATVRIDRLEDAASALGAFPYYPVVLKPTVSWAPLSPARLQAVEVVNETEARRVCQVFLEAGAGVLAQQWVGGPREGVTLFLSEGEVRASFAHFEHRTSPALGGASVLRESVAMPMELYEPAVRLVKAIGLDGLCEVEFRRDAHNNPLLMEVNARLPGATETAQRSGIDFPLMIWQQATGRPVPRSDRYRSGLRMRWLRGDMRWLRDNFRRTGRPDSLSARRAVWTFASEFVRTMHYDCLDPGDLGPVKAELRVTAAALRNASPIQFSRGSPNLKGAALVD